MNKTWIIAQREFWTTVKRKGYIFNTLGLPLLVLLVLAIALIPNWLSLKKSLQTRKIGLLDQSGIVRFSLIPQVNEAFGGKQEDFFSYIEGKNPDWESFLGKVEVTAYQDLQKGLQDLEKGKILLLYVVPPSYMENGGVDIHCPKNQVISSTAGTSLFVRRLLVSSLLQGKVSQEILKRVERPLRPKEFVLDQGGAPHQNSVLQEIGYLAVPYSFAMLLMFSLVITSAYLIQGMSEEKENRVIEIILSSISAQELFQGKLLGLGGAGLIQFFVWVFLGFTPALLVFHKIIQITPAMALGCFVYFLLGVFLCGSLTIGFASLGTRFHESHQFAMFWSLLSIIPIFFLSLIMDAPNGWLAKLFSYFPLTSPVTMVIRLSQKESGWMDIPISLVILLFSLWFALKISARLFRVGILLYGKKPGWREIWRYLWT